MFSSAHSGAVLAVGTALLLAGCGGDGDSTTEANLSSEREIEEIGNKWALLFAADDGGAACIFESQPVCEWIACEHVGHVPIENCTPPSPGYRRSYTDATVQHVAIKGENADVKFSNAEVVRFHNVQVPEGGPRPAWLVDRIGEKGPPVFK